MQNSSENKARVPVTIAEQKLARRYEKGRVVLIDDEPDVVLAFAALLEYEGYICDSYHSALEFVKHSAYYQQPYPGPGCIVCDVMMPELSGLELQQQLLERSDIPLILMSGVSGATEVVTAFRSGAFDFLLKPIETSLFLDTISRALQQHQQQLLLQQQQQELATRIAALTLREKEVVRHVAQGSINREIAEQMGIALRTVKLYRQRAMEKLGVSNVIELIRCMEQSNLLNMAEAGDE